VGAGSGGEPAAHFLAAQHVCAKADKTRQEGFWNLINTSRSQLTVKAVGLIAVPPGVVT
jgi:hypothetical protein